MGFFDKIFSGLRKTRNTVQLDGLFAGFTKADDDFYEELEECLILADVGMQVTSKVVSDLRKKSIDTNESDRCVPRTLTTSRSVASHTCSSVAM